MKTSDHYTVTGCKDCGRLITHLDPRSRSGMIDFFERFRDNKLKMVAYWDYETKHYLVIISDKPEKLFFSCATDVGTLKTTQEQEKILQWAGNISIE